MKPHLSTKGDIWSKHHEEVNVIGRHEIGGCMQRQFPCKVIVAPNGTRTITTNPFGVGTFESVIGRGEQDPSREHHASHHQTKVLDHTILRQLRGRLHECAGECVGEVWLEANVKETNDGESLIHRARTIIQPEKLEELQRFHRHEVPNSGDE